MAAERPIEAYWNNSPLKDVANVKTPTLFLSAKDPRVPMPQSLEISRPQGNGVRPISTSRRASRGWGELRHQPRLNAEIEWFEKYATKRPFTPGAPGDEKRREDEHR